MRSQADTADVYVAEAAPERRQPLERLRELARARLPDHVETMEYGMLSYQRDGVSEVAVASQKQHLAIYFMGGAVFERAGSRMNGHDHGKGCLRFRRTDSIDYDLVGDLMADRASQPRGGC